MGDRDFGILSTFRVLRGCATFAGTALREDLVEVGYVPG